MSSAIEDVVSGALYHELRMSTLANNIANVSTSGFKEDRVSFNLSMSDETAAGSNPEGSVSAGPEGSYMGNPVATYTNFASGQITRTGNPLDFALEGNGFFSIETPEGARYTRGGNFTLNSDGVLVTSGGHPVLGDGGEIILEGTRIEVDGSGSIFVDGGSVAQLKIVDFPEQSALVKTGKNMFTLADPGIKEEAAESAIVMQGYKESSNVDAVKTMTEMIEVLRGYEAYQKVIQFLNEANTKIINDVGGGN